MHKLESQASQLILRAEGYGESRLDIDILKQKNTERSMSKKVQYLTPHLSMFERIFDGPLY